jgi:hypothetical protein
MPWDLLAIELDPNKVHAQAFRDMEGEVSDLDRMGKSCATDHELRGERRQLPRLGAGHLCRLADGEDGESVQDQLSKRWYGELVGVS